MRSTFKGSKNGDIGEDSDPVNSSREADKPDSRLLSLEGAVTRWVEFGKADPLVRWLVRELDPEGVPKRLPVTTWEVGLRQLAEARERRSEDWPEQADALAEGWFRATLRFARPGGSPAFGEFVQDKARGVLFRKWAEALSDPAFGTVVDWWFPRSTVTRHSPPPLPADARPDRPLAILRTNWSRDGDFLAVDHRLPGTATQFELFGGGVPWLGPVWNSGGGNLKPASRPKPTHWTSQGSADVFEWSYRVGTARVTRTAVLLRCRRLALIGEQWDGADDPSELRIGLAEGIQARPIPDCRGLALSPGKGRGSARVYPIGLPRLPYATEKGAFLVEGRDLVLRQPVVAGRRRAWRALLVSWEPKRDRLPVHWRTLTVSENSKECSSGTAFASRLSWGRNDTLLVYRSLSRAGLRACLGHQTRARFLVGLFTNEGEVEPLLKLDE